MESIKVIFDINVWIGFLIGKRLSFIKEFIVNRQIIIITIDILIEEISQVTSRKKLKKYFPAEQVTELLELLEVISLHIKINKKHQLSRDPKYDFLLDLIDASKANYLVTGDKDLLELNPFKTAQIINPAQFEQQMEKI